MAFEATLKETSQAPEIRSQLLEAGEYLAGLNAVEREKRDAGWRDDTRSAVDFIHEWDPVLTAYNQGHSALPTGGGNGPIGATQLLGNPERRSAGDLFTADGKYNEFAEQRAANAKFFELELRGSLLTDNHEFRALLDSDGSVGGETVWRPVGTPSAFPPRYQQARLFVRDLMSVQGTNLSSVPYIRELTATTTELGASSVAEGVAKPEVSMLFEQDDAPVRKIAAWIPATEEIIDDAPTLRGYIDTRLAYMLALREEFEILNGSGIAPRLKGILQFTGLQTQAFSTDIPITAGLAIGKLENVDAEPDGIVMNPTKYWAYITTRNANQFDGGFGGNAPFSVPGGERLWGLPVIRSRVLTTAQMIVGAFRLGATLFDRMQTTIRVGNQHSTYFVENKIAILAEERVALAVHRPDFFVSCATA